jgi:hypothetical protein
MSVHRVVQDRVTMAERSSLGILACQADTMPSVASVANARASAAAQSSGERPRAMSRRFSMERCSLRWR